MSIEGSIVLPQIPDAYLPLASKYLQGVQGGAREVCFSKNAVVVRKCS